MRISKAADYALIVVGYMAGCSDDKYISRREMAEKLILPSEFLSKRLQKLNQANICESVKGINGGYRLTKPAGEIPMREVIELFDGHFHMVDCLRYNFIECKREKFCIPIVRKISEVELKINQIFDEVSFADLKIEI